jgi:hypothetical protein
LNLHREDGKFRTYHRAKITLNARLLHALGNFRIVIPFSVDLSGNLENFLRAKFNADLAALTALRNKINLSPWDVYLVTIDGNPCKDFHCSLTELILPRWTGALTN